VGAGIKGDPLSIAYWTEGLSQVMNVSAIPP